MKKLMLGFAAITFAMVNSVSAGDTHNSTPEYAPVVMTNDLVLHVNVEGEKNYITWDDNQGLNQEMFKYWKLMKGTDMNVPFYPEQSAISVKSNRAETSHKDYNNGHTKYYRICMITQRDSNHPRINEGKRGRYCSPAMRVDANGTTNNDSGTINEKPQPTQYDFKISISLQKKLTDIANRLIDRVNDLAGDNIDTKKEKLQIMIDKLNEFAENKPAIAGIFYFVRDLIQEELNIADIEALFGEL